jgi:hypothetical protein
MKPDDEKKSRPLARGAVLLLFDFFFLDPRTFSSLLRHDPLAVVDVAVAVGDGLADRLGDLPVFSLEGLQELLAATEKIGVLLLQQATVGDRQVMMRYGS